MLASFSITKNSSANLKGRGEDVISVLIDSVYKAEYNSGIAIIDFAIHTLIASGICSEEPADVRTQ